METNILKHTSWKLFKIGDIFTIATGANLALNKLRDGMTPRITAKDTNNGINTYNNTVASSNYRTNSNCVSISFLGSAFYQRWEASYDMKIHSIKPKIQEFNKYTGLFVATECKRQFSKFMYGNQLSSTDLPKQYLLLPSDIIGNPDWQFMEDYMKQQEYKMLQKVQKRLAGKVVSSLITRGSLSECKWKEFYFTEVFDEIQRGKRITKAQQIEGNIPYISSTAMNNGVDGFVGNTERVRIFENCITLANSGSVGNAFFQSYRFVASDHVTKLKATNLDKYAYLFMLPIINRLAEKYSFNREINDERIRREKLLLPVTENDDVDFEFMSSFAQNLEAKSIRNVIDLYLQRIDNQVVEWGG